MKGIFFLTDSRGLQEIRCHKCRKLIARGFVSTGHIEIMCPSCRSINALRAESPNIEPHDGLLKEVTHAQHLHR